jgi:ABC-2 type transport system permease protein
MFRLLASIRKEIILLSRDWAGLGLLFIMPMVLIIVMSAIQDITFKKIADVRLTVLFLDLDRDTLGTSIRNGLNENGFFEVVSFPDKLEENEENIRQLVASGKYQIGLVVRQGSTDQIRERGYRFVRKALLEEDLVDDSSGPDLPNKAEVVLYFDPVIKKSFRESIKTTLEVFTTKLESKILYNALSEEMEQLVPGMNMPDPASSESIRVEEIYATNPLNEIVPNSVQHNVPAWTIFAMFFIVIPLTGNLVKERDSGTGIRLKIMPGNYMHVMGSKLMVYLLVCLIQMILMLLVGVYLLPKMGLPSLEIGPNKLAIALMGISIGLAATGYGVLVGTVATTHEQAATFGSISVIILAALGGLWVPVFMMPKAMQVISNFSPLNWGLEGFYRIFLHGEGVSGVWKYVSWLFLFFLGALGTAGIFNYLKNTK